MQKSKTYDINDTSKFIYENKRKRGENMIKAYAKSDIGRVREINQDYYYISNSLDEVQLYMLADGMGGYKGGEIASKLAVQSAKSYIENNFKEIPKDKESIIQLVGSSMEYANMVVYEKSKEDNPVVKSIVRINYPEATSIYEYYSDIDATNKNVLKKFNDARNADALVQFNAGANEDGDVIVSKASQVPYLIPCVIPARFIQSIRGLKDEKA